MTTNPAHPASPEAGTEPTSAAAPPSLPPPSPPSTSPDELEEWALAAFYCPRCRTDIGHLASARFCPRCGAALCPPALPAIPVEEPVDGPREAKAPPLPPPLPLVPAATVAADVGSGVPGVVEASAVEAVLGEWRRLHQSGALRAMQPPAAGHGRPGDPRPAIVVGYANALCRLGWRYESHPGAGRNVPEAVRCYLKAARLGNTEALARLAPRCAGPDQPTNHV